MEQYNRLLVFCSILFIMIIWELIIPYYKADQKKSIRWTNNFLITIINTLLMNIFFLSSASGIAQMANENGYGLLNLFSLPNWLMILLSIILLDFAIYLQHLILHKVPLFWRFHRMHHADIVFDVTTALRFHPIEIICSMMYKIVIILIIGADPLSVILFEMILNGMAMFNHGNVKLPKKLDPFLRFILVTPAMHRIHHSVLVTETNSNFGFNISLWDRICKTYRADSKKKSDQIIIGLPVFRASKYLKLQWMLLIPFISDSKIDKEMTLNP